MSKTLENGSFQDAVGTVVNAGTIEFVLSQDAMIIAGGQVAPTRVTATLDSSGDMPSAFTILANDELTPSGTFYLTTVFDSNGARVFGPERWVFSGSSPIDLDTMTPTIVDPAFADPILSNPTAAQAIEDFNLTLPLLNNVRIVDGVKFTTIQAAIDDLTTGSSPGTVFVPAGLYQISASLLVNENNMTLIGEGRNQTIIECTNAAVNSVTVTANKAQMKGFDIRHSVQADSGINELVVQNSSDCRFDDIFMTSSNNNNGVLIDVTTNASEDGSGIHFNRVVIQNGSEQGFLMQGFSTTKRVLNIHLHDVRIASNTLNGLVLNDWVQGVFISGMSRFGTNGRNFFINATAADRTFDVFFQDSLLDNAQTGANFDATFTKRTFIKNCWIATTTGSNFNLLLSSTVLDSEFKNNFISFGAGGEISNSGDKNSFLGNTHFSTGSPTQAINIISGADSTVVAGCYFRGSYTTDITDSGTNSFLGPNFSDNNGGLVKFDSTILFPNAVGLQGIDNAGSSNLDMIRLLSTDEVSLGAATVDTKILGKLELKETVTLAADATPTVANGNVFVTNGSTAITAFDDGTNAQIIYIRAAASITITDGAGLNLNGATNYDMTVTDTLTLIRMASAWYEIGRSVN